MNASLETRNYYCEPVAVAQLVQAVQEQINLRNRISDIPVRSLRFSELTDTGYNQTSDSRFYSTPVIVEVELYHGSLFVFDKRHHSSALPLIIQKDPQAGYKIIYGIHELGEEDIPPILRQFLFDIHNPDYQPQVYISF